MDELAVEIDVKPRLSKMLFSDPGLSMRCFLGPCIPAQYRLAGPGANPDASRTIRHALSNNVTATRTRVLDDPRRTPPLGKSLDPEGGYGMTYTSMLERRIVQMLLLILVWQFLCLIYQHFL